MVGMELGVGNLALAGVCCDGGGNAKRSKICYKM